MKKRKMCGYVFFFLFVVGIMLMPVSAAEVSEKKTTEEISAEKAKGADETVEGTLQQTIKAANIMEEPDRSSAALASLEKGTAVVVYGEPENSFCRVEYRGTVGYIESSALEQYQSEISDNLEQEFQNVEEETLRTVDEYELLQKEKRTSRIWGTVIAVLVIAIFVVGIISTLKQSKGKEEDEG